MNHCDRCGAKTKPGEFLCAACYSYFCPQWDAEERERMEDEDEPTDLTIWPANINGEREEGEYGSE